MYFVSTGATKPLTVEVVFTGNSTKMEVDIDASVSLISEESFKTIRERGAVLHPSNAKLSGEPIRF